MRVMNSVQLGGIAEFTRRCGSWCWPKRPKPLFDARGRPRCTKTCITMRLWNAFLFKPVLGIYWKEWRYKLCQIQMV